VCTGKQPCYKQARWRAWAGGSVRESCHPQIHYYALEEKAMMAGGASTCEGDVLAMVGRLGSTGGSNMVV
jgi:hypothetical protein